MARMIRLIGTALVFAISIASAPAAKASFPGGNGVIVYSRGHGELWMVHVQSRRIERLTDTPGAKEDHPDWNAAGSQVTFSRCRGPHVVGNCDIWVMDADGRHQRRLTRTPEARETWPSWSPDGSRIAFVREFNVYDIWVMDADGSNTTKLTSGDGANLFPEWSPDGTQIVFTSSRTPGDSYEDIWVMGADGSNPVRLTAGPETDQWPDWSPDGSRITFNRDYDIWMMDADGANPTQLTSTRGLNELTPRSHRTDGGSRSRPTTRCAGTDTGSGSREPMARPWRRRRPAGET